MKLKPTGDFLPTEQIQFNLYRKSSLFMTADYILSNSISEFDTASHPSNSQDFAKMSQKAPLQTIPLDPEKTPEKH
jgi:hypothetical protein